MLKFVVLSNLKLATKQVEKMVKLPNFGFNELHLAVLTSLKVDDLPPNIKVQSIHKKANMCANLTPLHFACLNPNSNILKFLLDKGGDINAMDFNQRLPIHIAAACEMTDNLKLLIERGSNIHAIDF